MTTATNEDNIIMMQRYSDNYFDLSIVDPPYGIGEDGGKSKGRTTRKDGSIRNGVDQRNGSIIYRKTAGYAKKTWDKDPPNKDYFKELQRVSKNQIIFGANHFIENIPQANSSGWVVWNKVNGNSDFSDCELAWTSFNKGVRKFDFMWNGMLQGSASNGMISEGNKSKCDKRIHPTQKPVKLYEWLLMNYAKEGDKILDTHRGSASLDIACHNLNFDLVTCELDTDYFNDGNKRLKQHQAQLTMF